jgi:hypothetical protein
MARGRSVCTKVVCAIPVRKKTNGWYNLRRGAGHFREPQDDPVRNPITWHSLYVEMAEWSKACDSSESLPQARFLITVRWQGFEPPSRQPNLLLGQTSRFIRPASLPCLESPAVQEPVDSGATVVRQARRTGFDPARDGSTRLRLRPMHSAPKRGSPSTSPAPAPSSSSPSLHTSASQSSCMYSLTRSLPMCAPPA